MESDEEVNEEQGNGTRDCAVVDDGEDGPETVFCYGMRHSNTSVVVRVCQSKGLSFQLWPAASALCWYLEEQFGEAGMWMTEQSLHSLDSIPLYNAEAAAALAETVSKVSSLEISGLREKIQASMTVSTSVLRQFQDSSLVCTRRLKVLELGSGTGLVGIVAASLGADVVLTDLPHVISSLDHNVALNSETISAREGSVTTMVLRWGIEEDLKALRGLSYDLIVASDVVYYDNLFEPLLKTLKWLAGINKAVPCGRKLNKKHLIKSYEFQAPIPAVNAIHTGLKGIDSSSVQPRKDPRMTLNETVEGCFVSQPQNQRLSEESIPNTKASAARMLRNMEEQSTSAPVIYLAHLRRWKKDARFFRMASNFFNLQVVYRQSPIQDSRLGVNVYQLTKRDI